MITSFTNHTPQGSVAPTRFPVILLVFHMSIRFTLWQTHEGYRVASTKKLGFCRLICASFCVDTAYMSCVESYKGFLLHTLLANCIKAFAVCCLRPHVCTSIKRGELQHVKPVPDYINPARRVGHKNQESVTAASVCLSQHNVARKLIIQNHIHILNN